jgi:cobalt/nickel transport system permease protein
VIREGFAEGTSAVHRLDPRVKVCAAFPLAFVIALSGGAGVPLVGMAAAFLLLTVARIDPRALLKSLRILLFFLLFLWIVLPLTAGGETVSLFGFIDVSLTGVQRAFNVSLKSLAVVLLMVALLSTSTVFDLVHAMSHLKAPRKLLFLAFLSYRYIHVIQVEYRRMRNAMLVRGFRPRTNLHTYRSYGYLIGMLLIRSVERSERVYRAMLCRGFTGSFHLLDHFSMERKDVLFAALLTLLFAGCVWLQIPTTG